MEFIWCVICIYGVWSRTCLRIQLQTAQFTGRTRQLQQHPHDNDIRRQQRNAAKQHSPSISFVVCVSCGSSKKSPSKTCSRGGRYTADALTHKRQMQTGQGASTRRQQLHCNVVHSVLCFEYMLPCEFVYVIACTPKNAAHARVICSPEMIL